MIPGLELSAGVFPTQCYLKRFDESARACARRFGVTAFGSNTPLHDGILFAARALSRRHEPRRMLVIATDGQPDCEALAAQSLATAVAMGLEVYGLGIDIDITPVLPNSATLRSIDELPQVLFGLLDQVALSRAA